MCCWPCITSDRQTALLMSITVSLTVRDSATTTHAHTDCKYASMQACQHASMHSCLQISCLSQFTIQLKDLISVANMQTNMTIALSVGGEAQWTALTSGFVCNACVMVDISSLVTTHGMTSRIYTPALFYSVECVGFVHIKHDIETVYLITRHLENYVQSRFDHSWFSYYYYYYTCTYGLQVCKHASMHSCLQISCLSHFMIQLNDLISVANMQINMTIAWSVGGEAH